MPRAYRLISADSHVNEPPDLWQTRVAAKFRDRAPRIARLPDGDAWILEGVADPVNFGWNACAGLEPGEMKGWTRFEAPTSYRGTCACALAHAPQDSPTGGSSSLSSSPSTEGIA